MTRALVGMLAIGCMISGCEKPGSLAGLPPVLTATTFPSAVGTHWVYHVVDTRTGFEDTVDVSIISEDSDTSGVYVADWVCSFRLGTNHPDTIEVTRLADTMTFDHCPSRTYDSTDLPYQRIVFPVALGEGWGNPICLRGYDTSLVQSYELASTPTKVFRAYYIETWLIPIAHGELKHAELWLARNVGMVRAVITRGWNGPDNVHVWTLLSYHIGAQ